MPYENLSRLKTLMTGDEKHELASESTLDVLWVLYDRVLNVDPRAPDDPRRDRFLLSKGHGPMAYYAVLAAKGFIPMDALPTFGQYDSILGQHPGPPAHTRRRDLQRVPGTRLADGCWRGCGA